MARTFYKRPYLDSGVFIAWIKGETITRKDTDGNDEIVERGKIGEHVLTLAERGVYPITISALTIAEVHKKRGRPRLPQDENENILNYFEHDFVNMVSVDRAIGEEANRLCRKYEAEWLTPCDAIHLACAKRANCDVLLSWDNVLNSIKEPGISTEEPRIQEWPDTKPGEFSTEDATQGSLPFLSEPTQETESQSKAPLTNSTEDPSEES